MIFTSQGTNGTTRAINEFTSSLGSVSQFLIVNDPKFPSSGFWIG